MKDRSTVLLENKYPTLSLGKLPSKALWSPDILKASQDHLSIREADF